MGFNYVKNLWDFEHNQPFSARKITQKFKLHPKELLAIETMTILSPTNDKI